MAFPWLINRGDPNHMNPGMTLQVPKHWMYGVYIPAFGLNQQADGYSSYFSSTTEFI